MVLDRRFGAAGDEDELLDAGRLRLLDRILDQRLVDDRQHLLGHGLGGRQEARAEAADREYRLANALIHGRFVYCFRRPIHKAIRPRVRRLLPPLAIC